MRTRALILACLLLVSASVLAQHTTPGAPGTTSAPPPPPPHPPAPPSINTTSPASIPSHAPSESAVPKFEPPTFHASPPSPPPASSLPSPTRNSTVDTPKPEPAAANPPVQESKHSPETPKPVAEKPTSELKPISPVRAVSAENSETKKAGPAHSKLCPKNKPCDNPVSSQVSARAESNPAAARQCQAGAFWNGRACIPTGQQCSAGMIWNGATCIDNAALCGSFTSRAAIITTEAHGTKWQMEQACRKDPYSAECLRLTQEHDGEVLRYRMLLTEAAGQITPACQSTLPDPLTL